MVMPVALREASKSDAFSAQRGVRSLFYRAVGRRFSTIVLAGVAAAFVFEYGLDRTTRQIYESKNPGKFWKDVRATLPKE